VVEDGGAKERACGVGVEHVGASVAERGCAFGYAFLDVADDFFAVVGADDGAYVHAGFETIAETYAWPLDSAAVGKMPAPASDGSRAEEDRRNDAKARIGLPPSADADFYVTTQLPADPAAPDAVVLDVSSTLDHSLWIAVLRKKITDVGQLANRSLFVGVAFDEKVDTPPPLQTPPGRGMADQFAAAGLNTDPPPMIWQLWEGVGKGFSLLSIGDDTTRGMTTTGVVEVLLPAQLPAFDPTARTPADQDDQVNPPPLTDEKQAANVIAWIQVSRPKTTHINDASRRASPHTAHDSSSAIEKHRAQRRMRSFKARIASANSCASPRGRFRRWNAKRAAVLGPMVGSFENSLIKL